MFNFSFPDLADTYKNCHVDVYPEGMNYLASYLVPRKSMIPNQDKVVVFGIQAFLKRFKEITDEWFKRSLDNVIDDYKSKMELQLGKGNYETDHIAKLHKLGYLPLTISAIPEGSLVDIGVPIVRVTAEGEFAWLAQWTECWLQGEVWKPCNDATASYLYYKLLKKYYDKTSEKDPRMGASDFGMRGMYCMEEACKTSTAWLINFNKTSTVPAISFADYYYNAECNKNNLGRGAVSIEHSVISSNVANSMGERALILKLLNTYDNFSYVADTYDYWDIIKNVIPSIKTDIINHKGKILLRPDSGDQFVNVVDTIKSLWNDFGGTINSKGYKVLNSHVGVILGDGCTLSQVERILSELDKLSFASDNVLFGVGAFCFHAFALNDKLIVSTRDTFGFAQKTTYIECNNKELLVVKDPRTDKDKLKKSHKGLVQVIRKDNHYIAKDGFTRSNYSDDNSAFVLVFKNGEIIKEYSLLDIRRRLEEDDR